MALVAIAAPTIMTATIITVATIIRRASTASVVGRKPTTVTSRARRAVPAARNVGRTGVAVALAVAAAAASPRAESTQGFVLRLVTVFTAFAVF